MLGYAVRRVGLAIAITAVALATLIGAIQLIPGDPAAVLLGPLATPAIRAAFRVKMGLDQPVIVQMLRFFGRVLTGDLGTDVLTNRPVLTTVLEQLPFTLILVLASIGWSAALGIPLGCFAAVKRGSLADRVCRRAFGELYRRAAVRGGSLQPARLRRRATLVSGDRRRRPAASRSTNSAISYCRRSRSDSAGSATSRNSCAPRCSK